MRPSVPSSVRQNVNSPACRCARAAWRAWPSPRRPSGSTGSRCRAVRRRGLRLAAAVGRRGDAVGAGREAHQHDRPGVGALEHGLAAGVGDLQVASAMNSLSRRSRELDLQRVVLCCRVHACGFFLADAAVQERRRVESARRLSASASCPPSMPPARRTPVTCDCSFGTPIWLRGRTRRDFDVSAAR